MKRDDYSSNIEQDEEPTITTLQNILPLEKQKNQIKPFLSRIWTLPDSMENKQKDTLCKYLLNYHCGNIFYKINSTKSHWA